MQPSYLFLSPFDIWSPLTIILSPFIARPRIPVALGVCGCRSSPRALGRQGAPRGSRHLLIGSPKPRFSRRLLPSHVAEYLLVSRHYLDVQAHVVAVRSPTCRRVLISVAIGRGWSPSQIIQVAAPFWLVAGRSSVRRHPFGGSPSMYDVASVLVAVAAPGSARSPIGAVAVNTLSSPYRSHWSPTTHLSSPLVTASSPRRSPKSPFLVRQSPPTARTSRRLRNSISRPPQVAGYANGWSPLPSPRCRR